MKQKNNRSSKKSRKVKEFSAQKILINRDPTFVPERFRTILRSFQFVHVTPINEKECLIRVSPTDLVGSHHNVGATDYFGYSQLSQCYEYYRTHASSINVDILFRGEGPNHKSAASCGILASYHDYGVDPNINQLFQNSLCVVDQSSSRSPSSFRRSLTTACVTGVKNMFTRDNFCSKVSESPKSNWYWYVFVSSLEPIIGDVTFSLLLTATVDFSVPRSFMSIDSPRLLKQTDTGFGYEVPDHSPTTSDNHLSC